MHKTLVILAAGIGSRFGTGIKQLTPIDNNNHLIIDYRSVFRVCRSALADSRFHGGQGSTSP